MSAHITEEEVKAVAALARLGLTKQEVVDATNDLTAILGHFSQIQKIDTEGVPTYDDASGLNNVSAPDEALPEALSTHETLLETAPTTRDQQVQVKAVFANKDV